MTIIGDQFIESEQGWKRYDDMDNNISYDKGWYLNSSYSGYYNGNCHVSDTANSKSKFNFYGTSIRIINQLHPKLTSNGKISIDGIIYNLNEYINSGNPIQAIVFEKNGLSLKEHFVEIYTSDGTKIQIDAIDIDDNGELLPYNPNPNLYLIQDKNNNLYTVNENNLIQSSSQILDKNNFINNGFKHLDLITKYRLLSKFENLEKVKLLIYTDLYKKM